jgi:histidinol-phosphate phosphatase family protein
MPEAVLLMGYPASGKSSIAKGYVERGYVHLNRDSEGGRVDALVPKMVTALTNGRNVILDNTFPTVESRRPFIEAAHRAQALIYCAWLQSTIEDAQFNAAKRMIERRGRLLDPSEHKGEKDPNLFPVAVLFGYRKAFQKPSLAEGFDRIDPIPFNRIIPPEFNHKAVIVDYDGTIRRTKSGNKYPVAFNDIEILPRRKEVLCHYRDDLGYWIFGVSNQSGVAKGDLTMEAAHDCFETTNLLLGIDLEYHFCPHNPAPISCYCRKPMPGLFVALMMRHKLDPRQCIMVGDMTTDRTFASRCGMQYADQSEFFA